MEEETKIQDFLETNWDMLLWIIKRKWLSAVLIIGSLYLYNANGWRFSLYIGLLLIGVYIFDSFSIFKTLNEERKILQIVEQHIKPYQQEWSQLEADFNDDVFIENNEYTPEKEYEVSKFKVKDNYDEVYLDLHHQRKYHENMLTEIQKNHARVKSFAGPTILKSEELDELFYDLERLFRRVLSLKVKHHQPVVFFDDYLIAYNEFYFKMKNYHEKEFNIVNKGITGEKNTENELKLLKKTEEIDYLDNAVLTYENKSFETDFIIFSNQGMYSLEVKNIGGNQKFTIRITSDGQWLKVFNNGKVEPMQDVTSQMNYHISMTNLLISKYEKETGKVLPPIQPIYIIGNNDVVIDNQSELNIFRPSYFVHFLRAQKKVVSMAELKEFMTWVQEYRSEPKKYPLKDYSKQFKNLADLTILSSKIKFFYYEISENIISELKKDPKLVEYLQKKNRLNEEEFKFVGW